MKLQCKKGEIPDWLEFKENQEISHLKMYNRLPPLKMEFTKISTSDQRIEIEDFINYTKELLREESGCSMNMECGCRNMSVLESSVSENEMVFFSNFDFSVGWSDCENSLFDKFVYALENAKVLDGEGVLRKYMDNIRIDNFKCINRNESVINGDGIFKNECINRTEEILQSDSFINGKECINQFRTKDDSYLYLHLHANNIESLAMHFALKKLEDKQILKNALTKIKKKDKEGFTGTISINKNNFNIKEWKDKIRIGVKNISTEITGNVLTGYFDLSLSKLGTKGVKLRRVTVHTNNTPSVQRDLVFYYHRKQECIKEEIFLEFCILKRKESLRKILKNLFSVSLYSKKGFMELCYNFVECQVKLFMSGQDISYKSVGSSLLFYSALFRDSEGVSLVCNKLVDFLEFHVSEMAVSGKEAEEFYFLYETINFLICINRKQSIKANFIKERMVHKLTDVLLSNELAGSKKTSILFPSKTYLSLFSLQQGILRIWKSNLEDFIDVERVCARIKENIEERKVEHKDFLRIQFMVDSIFSFMHLKVDFSDFMHKYWYNFVHAFSKKFFYVISIVLEDLEDINNTKRVLSLLFSVLNEFMLKIETLQLCINTNILYRFTEALTENMFHIQESNYKKIQKRIAKGFDRKNSHILEINKSLLLYYLSFINLRPYKNIDIFIKHTNDMKASFLIKEKQEIFKIFKNYKSKLIHALKSKNKQKDFYDAIAYVLKKGCYFDEEFYRNFKANLYGYVIGIVSDNSKICVGDIIKGVSDVFIDNKY